MVISGFACAVRAIPSSVHTYLLVISGFACAAGGVYSFTVGFAACSLRVRCHCEFVNRYVPRDICLLLRTSRQLCTVTGRRYSRALAGRALVARPACQRQRTYCMLNGTFNSTITIGLYSDEVEDCRSVHLMGTVRSLYISHCLRQTINPGGKEDKNSKVLTGIFPPFAT